MRGLVLRGGGQAGPPVRRRLLRRRRVDRVHAGQCHTRDAAAVRGAAGRANRRGRPADRRGAAQLRPGPGRGAGQRCPAADRPPGRAVTVAAAQTGPDLAGPDLRTLHRPVVDKQVSARDAVGLVRDGDHIAIGGTLYSRTPMALLFELLRTGRTGLTLSRPLACHETGLFLASGAAERVVTSWVGIGLRWGLSPVLRHYVENGLARYDEWSHLALGLRYT